MSIDSSVAFAVGPISIYWYSLAYVFGIMFTYWYLHILDNNNQKIFTKSFYDSLLITTMIGILLGGRVGYILIYDPVFYINNLSEIPKTWKGGMSFHGGVVGVLCAVIVSCKRNIIPIFYTLDLISCGVPIGLFLGRVGNFLNGELFGRVTTLPWGMIFPESGDNLPRHPSQLYEAFFEGIVFFIIINLLFFLTRIKLYRGGVTGIALALYGVIRFVVEFFRAPDCQIGYLYLNLTMGQLLSLPMFILGIILYLNALNLKKTINR